MIHAQVGATEQEALHAEMKRTTEAKWYRRLKVIDLSSQGYSVAELAQLFDLAEGTIRHYIHGYNDGGLAGLQPAYGQGRPRSLTWTKAEWLDLLAQSPGDYPELKTAVHNWTQDLLLRYLATYHQIQVTQTTLSKTLRRVGIRWRRAKRRVHSPDPLYVVKRQRVADLQQLALSGDLTSEAAAHPRSDEPPKLATLVFLDSTNDVGTHAREGWQMSSQACIMPPVLRPPTCGKGKDQGRRSFELVYATARQSSQGTNHGAQHRHTAAAYSIVLECHHANQTYRRFLMLLPLL